ncbi:protein containing Toll-Interleukin receptor [Candidatus Magnetomorum sp. HK-1]|nr:protein containing Toll-Interleukin receptor [Candidatus Magnetomorum sp. HK-1]
MSKIFLSYSRKNEAFVEKLYKRLSRDGIDCFFDKESIAWGANWYLELEKGIDEADCIVLILSPDFCKSEWASIEQSSARLKDPSGVKRRIRPLLLEPCGNHIPPFLQTIQQIDVSSNDLFENNYPKICKDLGGTLTKPDEISAPTNHLNSNAPEKSPCSIVTKSHEIPKQKPQNKSQSNHINPYDNREMLMPDSDMFFGRQREMNTIRDLINHEKNVSIVGERRIGKSSLAFRLYHEFKDIDNTIAVYIDCDFFPETLSTKDFYIMLSDTFKNALQDNQSSQDLFACFRTFKRFIEKNAQKGVSFIIFFDEFERLVKMPCADDTFFSNLRSLGNNPLNNLAYVTLSKLELRKLVHHAIQSSKFWNIFHPITLGLIDEPSIKALRETGFQKAGFQLTDEDITLIHDFAGRFPFFNQIVCFHVFESKVSNTAINKNQIISVLAPHYQILWETRSREEQNLLKKIRRSHMVKQEFLLNDMIVRGLVQKENDSFFTFSKFFADLIRQSFKIKKNDTRGNGFIFKAKKLIALVKEAKEITQ